MLLQIFRFSINLIVPIPLPSIHARRQSKVVKATIRAGLKNGGATEKAATTVLWLL